MENLDEIVEQIHQDFETRTKARDQALQQARILTRHCAKAIRAVHRDEYPLAQEFLDKAGQLVHELAINLADFPDIFYAGYTQDAFKEFAEAQIVMALVKHQPLPTPEELGLNYATYLKGLAEAVGELRRRCLDIIRHSHSAEAEHLLSQMDEIYAILVTMDYPDAITGGLRRLTDLVRGITERTRGDLTISLRQESLEQKLQALEEKIAPD
ncbi:MAG: haloacid dehalogenase [Anaerolineales bacterium]|nr:haloacid dehalogenase [Anaerolineales bacterium]